MNARLLVAVALPLLFVTPGLPVSQLSADQDKTITAADGTQGPDGCFNHCLHQHARQLRRKVGITPHARLSAERSTSSIT